VTGGFHDTLHRENACPDPQPSANFFEVMGVPVRLGSGFLLDDDRPGTRRMPAVISERLWRRYFNGLLPSLGCGPLLRSYLFGLSPVDPIAYAGVLALLAVSAVAATYVPARRACRVDPALTLREE
jgi:hypothetical protein